MGPGRGIFLSLVFLAPCLPSTQGLAHLTAHTPAGLGLFPCQHREKGRVTPQQREALLWAKTVRMHHEMQEETTLPGGVFRISMQHFLTSCPYSGQAHWGGRIWRVGACTLAPSRGEGLTSQAAGPSPTRFVNYNGLRLYCAITDLKPTMPALRANIHSLPSTVGTLGTRPKHELLAHLGGKCSVWHHN